MSGRELAESVLKELNHVRILYPTQANAQTYLKKMQEAIVLCQKYLEANHDAQTN